MYLSHFGLSEPPFRITPHTDFFFDGANRGATLEALLYAILNDEGIVKVSGEVGSGKTMLCRVLLERLPAHVETIYLATPSFSRDEIFRAIAEDLKVDVRGKRTTLLLRALQDHLIDRYARGHRVVVLIDEAHAMPAETLEEIRLLSNLESNRHKLLQIVLFGQPELDAHLATPGMRQLRERITHSFALEPLVRKDIDSYIDFRMRAAGYKGRNAFAPAALRLIATASRGLTRRINILADKALLAAFADSSHEVTLRHARAAVKDAGFGSLGRRVPTAWLAAGGAVAGALLVVAAQLVWPLLRPGPAASGATRELPTTAAPGVSAPATTAPASPEDRAAVPASAPASPSRADEPRPPAADDRSPRGADTVGDRNAAVVLAAAEGLPRVGAPAPAFVPPPPAELPPAVVARAPAQGSLARERFAATQHWLAGESPDHFSIQLLTADASDLAWMETFLRRARESVRAEDLHVYSWKSNGRHNYRVALGSYPSAQDAATALAQLPPALKAYKPYPESVAVIRRLNAED